MKIKSVTASWLHVPIPEKQQHTSDFGATRSFDSTLVRIETEGGLVGYGEAKAEVGSTGKNAGLDALINEELSLLLVGEDARDISRLWDVMYNGSRAHFAIDRGRVFPVLGRRGHLISAISGIDMALWDILGKSLGEPVWRLLGGRRKVSYPAYASGGWAPTAGIVEELQSFIDRGNFKAVKMRVGAGDGTLAHSVERVKAARAGLAPDIDIMCDAHGTFSVAEAKRFCREVADCNIGWLEEPVVADDKRGMAEVRASSDVPISTGESEFTRFAFRDLAELRACDIFQPDLSICGGVTEAMRIEAIASAFQLRFAPHLWGGALTFASGLHVLSVASTGFIVEYSLGANPMLHELVVEDFTVVDGHLEIPDRPGLGVTVDEEFVEKYRVKN
ncbi:MAG: mandelate racemase/muconate lactonizing enzyme family protein [Alphaproteobacteria bacterium]|jgi:L-alanine-DL-glutamate epimerase-like enolase superfamily enzyme|nr:mandelate racemase/muconate lactonizing enzyme family protein [Alphaproteobacteria bacterium]|tara:strand:- start:861 stop:2030 length:1170 start_codon:yes stop_codon:yes gene_type:complete